MKNRIKNLTPKKIKRITAIVTTILYLAYVALGAYLCPNSINLIFFMLVALVLFIMFALFMYNVLLRINGLHDHKEKEIADTFLSKDKFTLLSFFLNCGETEAKMLSAILHAEGCKFYAKLTEDDNILLIIKDKNDDEIYNTIISNYLYFTNHFKPKEN